MIEHDGKTYFTKQELGCKHCGYVKLSPGFNEQLLDLRLEFNEAMVVNSACRCETHNRNVGGHPRSMHIGDKPARPTGGCCAIDIAWRNWPIEKQLRFARLAFKMGWAVGLHNGFCHIDRRTIVKLPKIVFLYGSWDGKFSPADVQEGV